jgi:8-oxo-dGTP diphosphatase
MTNAAQKRPAIAAAVVAENGRVLMVRRRIAEGELSWQFPAGEVESNETAEEAAVRETSEETGVAVRAVNRLGERVHPATGRMMIYVECEVISGAAHVADPEDLAEVEWCDASILSQYVTYPFYGPVQAYLNSKTGST